MVILGRWSRVRSPGNETLWKSNATHTPQMTDSISQHSHNLSLLSRVNGHMPLCGQRFDCQCSARSAALCLDVSRLGFPSADLNSAASSAAVSLSLSSNVVGAATFASVLSQPLSALEHACHIFPCSHLFFLSCLLPLLHPLLLFLVFLPLQIWTDPYALSSSS